MPAKILNDVGHHNHSEENLTGQSITSNEKAIRKGIHVNIFPAQVASSALAFAPSWKTDKYMKQEHDGNWHDSYEKINEPYLTEDANVVSPHAIFKIKKYDNSNLTLKGWMFCLVTEMRTETGWARIVRLRTWW